MHKTNIIIIALASLTCALTITAGPTNAYFEAKTPGATKGPIAKFPTTMSVSIGSVETLCTRTTKTTGFWNIQTSEDQVITKGTKQQQQPGTKIGAHEAITILDWGSCKALGGIIRLSPCRLQVAQSKGATIGHGSIQTDCGIEIPAAICTITFDQQPANHNLQSVNLENNEAGQGVVIKVNTTGITFKTTGAGCASIGLPAESKAAGFKTGTSGDEGIETSLQKLI